MPDWLYNNENYLPQKDKDRFINKSIIGLLGLLAHLKAQDGKIEYSYQVKTELKVVGTFLLTVLLSAAKNFTFVMVETVFLLLFLSLLDGRDIIKILKLGFIAAGFTWIIMLPAALGGNHYSTFMITVKVFVSVSAVNILSRTSKWSEITAALKCFFVPDIFIFVLDITIKYISLLGEFSLEMLYSLKLRSIGRNNKKYSSLSGVAGTMFVKSTEMAEEMYQAMECRGFTGEYIVKRSHNIALADVLFISVNIVIIFAYVYLERILS